MQKSLTTFLVAIFSVVVIQQMRAENPPPRQQQIPSQQTPPPNPQIDFQGFLGMLGPLAELRQKHRVPTEKFMAMAKEQKTIILDTRSKKAFDEIHFDGAVHLNFSDFNEHSLAKLIPDETTRILIYCNNNFLPNHLASLQLKKVSLALNIPTFANLHGYGYKNVYELADVIALDDPRIKLDGTKMPLTMVREN